MSRGRCVVTVAGMAVAVCLAGMVQVPVDAQGRGGRGGRGGPPTVPTEEQ